MQATLLHGARHLVRGESFRRLELHRPLLNLEDVPLVCAAATWRPASCNAQELELSVDEELLWRQPAERLAPTLPSLSMLCSCVSFRHGRRGGQGAAISYVP